MSLIYCPECGKEVSEEAVNCPQCGKPLKTVTPPPVQQPPKKNGCGCGCLSFIIALIVVVGISAIAYIGMDSGIQSSISGVTDESEYISLEEYNQIKSGMSYEEVCNIIGSEGTVTSTSTVGDYTISIVTWYGNGSAGSNANVTFQNGAATGKAQIGLK